MKNSKYLFIIVSMLFCIGASAQTDTLSAGKDSVAIMYKDSVRNQRYCEMVVAKGGITGVTVYVYNTLGYNACPEEQWKAINTDKYKKQLSANAVVANGPRYFTMDRISVYDGDSITVMNFDSLQLKEWFKIRMSVTKALSMRNQAPYKERSFKLATANFFAKGSMVFQLVTPLHTYIMQSYSAEVDSSLTINDLPNLAQRLKLPDGWAYKVVTLDNDLELITVDTKESYGLEDEFGNRYQRMD